jgi:hypothetical protein
MLSKVSAGGVRRSAAESSEVQRSAEECSGVQRSAAEYIVKVIPTRHA